MIRGTKKSLFQMFLNSKKSKNVHLLINLLVSRNFNYLDKHFFPILTKMYLIVLKRITYCFLNTL